MAASQGLADDASTLKTVDRDATSTDEPAAASAPPKVADAESLKRLANELQPFYRVWSGQQTSFAVHVEAEIRVKDELQPVTIHVERFGHDTDAGTGEASSSNLPIKSEWFDFTASHPEYAVEVYRRDEFTAMVLPKHSRVFMGEGPLDEEDHLSPLGMATRLTSVGSNLWTIARMLSPETAEPVLTLASHLTKIEQIGDASHWRFAGEVDVRFDLDDKQQTRLRLSGDGNEIAITITPPGEPKSSTAWDKNEQVAIPRGEMEQQFSRGIRRAWEVIWPSSSLANPAIKAAHVPHGEIRNVEGQRLVILHGTPEQIGTAHGKLLRQESQRCIDSVLNAFGSVQTIASGRWFRHDLASAYERLRPHIPEDHIAETRALAVSLGQDPQLLEMLNVFPELFHCSGFAVFDSATVGGKLYHGRVLDYMTTIGLQDSATTFVVAVDDKIPFVNIGYAGFVGSVSGMNADSISLGEMGGRGEGKWDGVPMATLMRRALEECSTLDEVIELWRTSPRTCEYYYVFANGKTNDAVGVAATPETFELVRPGEYDERLGEGITDAVVLSAGGRLATLRERVIANHGKIDAEKAMWLMSRPVAMNSNLHNVLFVPADGVLYVANADHRQPAAERPYVKYDLLQLLKDPALSAASAGPAEVPIEYTSEP